MVLQKMEEERKEVRNAAEELDKEGNSKSKSDKKASASKGLKKLEMSQVSVFGKCLYGKNISNSLRLPMRIYKISANAPRVLSRPVFF